jgi:hypothetical protein
LDKSADDGDAGAGFADILVLTTIHLRDRQTEAQYSSGSTSTGSEWEHVSGAPPTLSNFDRARANLCTPKRLKVGPLLASLADTSPSEGVVLEPLEEGRTVRSASRCFYYSERRICARCALHSLRGMDQGEE